MQRRPCDESPEVMKTEASSMKRDCWHEGVRIAECVEHTSACVCKCVCVCGCMCMRAFVRVSVCAYECVCVYVSVCKTCVK